MGVGMGGLLGRLRSRDGNEARHYDVLMMGWVDVGGAESRVGV